MSTRLNVALVAEFDLCEKLAEALEQSCLEIEKVSVVELFPFAEEQGIRFNNKSVAQIALDETEWSDFDYVFFAGELAHATHIAKAASAGCMVTLFHCLIRKSPNSFSPCHNSRVKQTYHKC